MNPSALAAVAAAIAGRNPRIQHTAAGLVLLNRAEIESDLDPSAAESDLEVMIDEMLFVERPGAGRVLRVHPQQAVIDVARCADLVIWATCEHLGVDPLDVDRHDVAERLRASVRAARSREAHDATD